MPEANLAVVGGAKLHIGGTISDYTLAQFQLAGRTWTEIKGLESIGDFGDEAEIVTAKQIDGARVRKVKGTSDAGSLEVTVFRDPLDAGQVAMRAAAKTKSTYAIRITANDSPTGGTGTVHYVAGIVASAKNSMAGADDLIKTTFTIALDAAPLSVEATA